MAAEIHIQAEDVWSFYNNNIKRLSEEMIAIAENTETKYAVYLTEDSGYPLFVVCQGDNDAEYDEGAISERDCTETAKKCYLRYICPSVINSDKNEPRYDEEQDSPYEPTEQELEDEMYEREDELVMAMGDFLRVALQDGVDGSDVVDIYGHKLIGDVLDRTLRYVAEEYGLSVYRPMFIVNDLGKEEYLEFPYNADEPEDLSDSLSYE